MNNPDDDGNWQLSINELQAIKAEADVYIGWNLWKMQKKDEAASIWREVIFGTIANDVAKASAHAGLGIYYAEKGNKEVALEHAQFAQDLLPEDATANQNKNLNACGIALAKIGELEKAEEILLKVARINEQLMKSDDPEIVREATHQRGKNGYNLASLVYIPQERFYEAIKELEEEVIPRYKAVGAETDLAAAYHRIAEVNEKIAEGDSHSTVNTVALNLALPAEKKSLSLWQKYQEDAPGRVETAMENIKRIENKMGEQE